MLELFAFPHINDIERENEPAMPFQKDGVPHYFSYAVSNAKFPNRWAGRRGPGLQGVQILQHWILS
jgi:hypothetical protein